MKKIKKGSPRPKASGRSAPRTRKKPFRLEVGKTYETREDGYQAEVIGRYHGDGNYSFIAKFLPNSHKNLRGWETPYGPKGEYWGSRETDSLDLIREVPSAKRPVAPKGRRAPRA